MCHSELFGSCLLAAALWPKECGQPCPHAFLYFSVCIFMTWARLLGSSTNDPECSLWARPCKVYSYPLVVMHILNVRSTEGTSSHCLNYWPCSVSGVFAGRLLEVGWFPWVTAMSERVQWDGLSWFTCLSWFTAPHTGAILQLTLYGLCLFSMTMMLHWSSENSDHCVYLKKPGWFQHCILRPHYMCGPTMYSIYIIYMYISNIYITHIHTQFTQDEAVGAGRPQTHLSLWQARLSVSGLVAWFLHRVWASPCLCCLVTVRSRLWFMQIARQGLVGQPRYVVRPSLGQCTKASQQKQSGCISNQERCMPLLVER